MTKSLLLVDLKHVHKMVLSLLDKTTSLALQLCDHSWPIKVFCDQACTLALCG